MDAPPIFVIAGLPRSGTTYLYYALREHPEIFTPVLKEAHYFSYRNDYGLAWFRKLYAGQEAGQTGMDNSPAYVFDPASANRIKAYDPDTKVIISVRQLSELACSFYAQRQELFYDNPPFEAFLDTTYVGNGSKKLDVSFTEGIITSGIQEYQKVFGKQLLLINFSVLRHDTLLLLQAIERFLGLNAYFSKENMQNKVINASDRSGIKWLNKLSRNEFMLKNIVRFPFLQPLAWQAKMLLFTRINKARKEGPYQPPETQLQLAREKLVAEDAWVEAFFREHNFMLGDGTPFLMEGVAADERR